MAAAWTNKSVLRLAGKADPVATITERARALVLRALDKGWFGPPFDPLILAELLGIEVAASDVVTDARLVPLQNNKLRIEFNPNRARGRVRFSIAHEIAHTLFPDCAAQVQNRGRHRMTDGDTWQLEALCNMAAAELLMPAAALTLSADTPPSIEDVLEERKRFDVSTEALLIRVARTARRPMSAFTASETDAGRLRIDYAVESPASSLPLVKSGAILPQKSLLTYCSGIGFTAHGAESWGKSPRLRVEAVGIPPLPGGSKPRVAGLVWPEDAAARSDVRIQFVKGDATLPHGPFPALIVHIVNDATPIWGGNGFAAALRKRYPNVPAAFRSWWTSQRGSRLGRAHVMSVSDDVWVASLVAQHGFGPSAFPRIRYGALRPALEHAAVAARIHRLSVHMPRIGSGQAGGRWVVVEELVRQAFLSGGSGVTVYDPPSALEPAAAPPSHRQEGI